MDAPNMKQDDFEIPVIVEPLLSQTLGFDRDDLLANRNGIMTEPQRKRLSALSLLRRHWWELAGGVFCGLLFLFFASNTGPTLMNQLCLPGIFGVLTALFAGIVIRKGWQMLTDLRVGKVAVVEGAVMLNVVGNRTPLYQLGVEKLKFDVSKDLLYTFQTDKRYRVYYAPRSKTILSAELVVMVR